MIEQLPKLAISIQQPWAWLIHNGYKPVENRTWWTKIRGPVAIHAGLKLDTEGYKWVKTNFPDIPLPAPDEFDRGGIVGTMVITDCVIEYNSPWFFGPYGFVIEDAKKTPFVPLKGNLRFFNHGVLYAFPPKQVV
jgi:hypothetical protein